VILRIHKATLVCIGVSKDVHVLVRECVCVYNCIIFIFIIIICMSKKNSSPCYVIEANKIDFDFAITKGR
jgi:hypothetical protein